MSNKAFATPFHRLFNNNQGAIYFNPDYFSKEVGYAAIPVEHSFSRASQASIGKGDDQLYINPAEKLDAVSDIGNVHTATFSRASQASNGTHYLSPNNIPRIFGSDTKSPAILIEGQRTNIFRYGDVVGPVGSTPTGLPSPNSRVVSLDVPRPFGYGPVVKHTRTGADSNVGYMTNTHYGSSLSASTLYTASLYVFIPEDSTTTEVLIRFEGAGWGGASGYIYADINKRGVWQRLVGTHTTASDPSSNAHVVFRVVGGSSGTAYVYTWGWQLEQGSHASTVIPTTGNTVTRTPDSWHFPYEMEWGEGHPKTINFAVCGLGVYNNWNSYISFTPDGAKRFRLENGSNGALYWVYLNTSAGASAATLNTPKDAITNRKWYVISIVCNEGGTQDLYRDGVFISNRTDVEPVSTNGIRFYNNSTFQVNYFYTAPGATGLGIPFIDNRAWSAEEIEAAHAVWLAELNKVALI